jgi:hypothetical protein
VDEGSLAGPHRAILDCTARLTETQQEEESQMMSIPEELEVLVPDLGVGGGVHEDH